MKKQTVVMICITALLLLVSCFGIYRYIYYQNSRKPQNIELFSCMPSDIVEYSVKNGKETYTLVKIDGMWQVEGNDVAVLDQKAVQNAVNSASVINAQGVLRKKELELFDFTAVQTLTLTLTDGNKFKVSFAGHNGETSAIRINDEPETYKVHKSMNDILMTSLDKLRAAQVFEQLTKMDEPLSYYSFTDYDKTKTVVRTKTAWEISKSKSNRYIMESPYKKEVDDEKFEQQFVVRIPLLAAISYMDDFSDDMTKYGLDKKSCAVLEFKWGNCEETLYLGAEEGGIVYAEKKGQEGIFAINTSQLEFLHTEPFYILKTGILNSDIENVRSITVKVADATYEVRSLQRGTANGQFFVNGMPASKLAFDSILKLLNGIEIISEVSGEPKDKGEIVIMVYYDNGTAVQKISLTKLNDLSYVAFINGKAEFDVSCVTVEALLDELNNISKNPMKTDKEG